MPTARVIKRYTCFECKTEHSEDNMVAYGACCYSKLKSCLAQARAEMEAVKRDRDEWKDATITANQRFKQAEAALREAQQWRATHEGCHEKWDGLQAQVSDLQAKLADEIKSKQYWLSQSEHAERRLVEAKEFHSAEYRDRIAAESQAAELRRALEKIVKKNARGYTYDRDEVFNIAKNTLAALDSAQKGERR